MSDIATTPVTLHVTTVKMVDESNDDAIVNETVNGKLNNRQASAYAKSKNLSYVNKTVTRKIVNVPTDDIFKLAIDSE